MTTTKPAAAGDAFRKLANELQEASAAFRTDYLHHKMTGATVVLEDDAADSLADLQHEAGTAITLLLYVIAQASKDTQ